MMRSRSFATVVGVVVIAAAAGAVALGLGACGGKSGGGAGGSAAAGAFHEKDVIARYRALGDSGYMYLEQGKTPEAVAVFTRQVELIPTGRQGAYNIACAYARAGEVEKAIEWTGKAVDSGWEDAGQLRGDTDLASLQADPRFQEHVQKAEANRAAAEAAFAAGLPKADPPAGIKDEAQLAAWADSLQRRWSENRPIWFPSQTIAAGLRIEAQRIAAQQALAGAGGEFDAGLERVRAMSNMRSPYEPWGPLARGVVKEADAYLAGKPTEAGRSEADFLAGAALYYEKNSDDTSEPGWSEAAAASQARFARVGPGSPFAGAAAAWQIRIELAEAGESKEAVFPKVRDFLAKYESDQAAMDVAATAFQRSILEAKWPIPIETVDVDNKPVSLNEYKGKVVLVDFWATWCGPCRGELPYLRSAYEKFHPKGFEILSISLDFPEKTSVDAYKLWCAQNGMNWRHVYEMSGWKSKLAAAYFVRGIPSPVLVGRDGSIVGAGEDCRGTTLDALIEKALSGPA